MIIKKSCNDAEHNCLWNGLASGFFCRSFRVAAWLRYLAIRAGNRMLGNFETTLFARY